MRTDDWPERQRKAARRRRREDGLVNVLAGAILGSGVVALVVLLLFLGAVSVWIGWNLGVVGAAKAFGDSVGEISLWTALGLSFLMNVLGRLFRDDIKIDLKKSKS